ncbi:ABC transporter permease [Pseudoalteromonas phenolica]|uniref:ABC transporter permease n=1 Tax=Pseudoalteromonas phenolica TaxID=161398 RepID=UPI00207BB155|nr:ABC transporter permease [Pseudoalteromonas phenolica]
MSILKQEFKLAISSLLRLPGFSLTVITTLAVTLAALAVVININYLVLTKPLPYPNADKLIVTDQSETINGDTQYGFQILSAQYHIYSDKTLIETMALMSLHGEKLRDVDGTPFLDGARVTPEYFSMLAVPMHLGRHFNEDEGVNFKQRVLVLSYDMWQEHFGANPNIIGTFTTVGNHAYKIVGVTAELFQPPEVFGNFPLEAWFSFDQEIDVTNRWASITGGINGIAILKDNVSIEQANKTLGAQINELYLSRDDVAPNTSIGAQFMPLKDKIIADSDEMALLLLAGVLTLLFIAVTNMSNLFLSRAVQKQRVMAIQAAIGAKTKHIFWGMFSETIILTMLACVFGLLIAGWTMVWLESDLQYMFPRMQRLALDPTTITASFIITLVIAVIMAKLASNQVNYEHLNEALQSSGKGTGAQISSTARNVLVAVQVGLATALLLGATTVLTPAVKRVTQDVAFNTDNVHYVRVDVGQISEGFFELTQQLKSQFKDLPQVKDVTLTRLTPLQMGWENYLYDAKDTMLGIVSTAQFDSNTFELLGIPMLHGRSFSELTDSNTIPQEIIISESLAKRLFNSNEAAIGQTLQARAGEPLAVVGVVGDIYVPDRQVDYARERYYLPFIPNPRFGLSIKTDGPISDAEILATLKQVNPMLSIGLHRTLNELLTLRLREPTLIAILTVSLITLALSLAAAGIYGVLSYSVQMRRYELGIHLSLGAHTGQVIKMVMKQSMQPVVIGLVLGGLLAGIGYLLGTRLLAMSITGDLTVLIVALPVIALISLLACYLPVKSVIASDPIKALRNE